MTFETKKPVALVTGGTTGIGLATARRLHQAGYSVVATGNNPHTLASARKYAAEGLVFLRADARSMADSALVAKELQDRWGGVDFVFLNAGIARMLPIEAIDEKTFDDHFSTNVKGQFFMLQKVLPLIRDGGSVLFCTAVGTRRGIPNWTVVTATKGALEGMVPSLAVELAPRNIRVNAVRPGVIDTPAFQKLGLPTEAVDGFKAAIPAKVPLGRFGTGDDVAEVAVFLASSAARYITGATFDVDGGMSHAA